MIKVYGTWLCPDCRSAEHKLNEAGIGFEFIDIFNSTSNMKEFLKLRDNSPVFKEVKEVGGIGIPVFVVDEQLTTLNVEDVL